MKALVKKEKGKGFVGILECDKPTPKENEVLIKVAYTGICGTDIHILHDEFSYWPPVIMGHEFSGVVEEVGAGVTGYKKGDRVVGEPHNKACGKCHLCRNGKIQICDSKRSIGWGIDGAFAAYLCMPENLLHKVSDNISLKSAAVAEPCAIVAHQLLEKCGINPGDIVVIMGMGAIAIIAAQMARAAGAGQIIMCGCTRDTGIRLDYAKKTNCCDKFVNVENEDIVAIINEMTEGRGADVVVEAAGATPAIVNALKVIKKAGTVCAIGLTGKDSILIPWDIAMKKAITVQFNMSSSYNGWEMALRMMENGMVQVEEMAKVMKMEEWEDAFSQLEKGEAIKILLDCGE